VRQRIEELLGASVSQVRAVGASHGTRHLVATLADGREAFIKETGGGQHAGELAAEANGLRWLAEAGGVPVPEVIAHDDNLLVIQMLPAGRPTSAAARAFGTGLARTHAAGAPGGLRERATLPRTGGVASPRPGTRHPATSVPKGTHAP